MPETKKQAVDPREKLLKDLMRQLENYKLPERYTAEQKKKIMSGRSGQASIDEGRRTISENERLYQEALTRRGELQDRVTKVQGDIETSQSRTREQAQEDWERSGWGQAYETSKFVVPGLGGMYLGHRTAKGIENRHKQMSPARQQSMGAGRRFAPYAGKASTYFIPEGIALREYVAGNMKPGAARDVVEAGGTGLIAAGGVTMGEGLVRSLTPKAIPGVDDGLPPGGPPPNALAAAGPQSTPPAAPPQQSPRIPPPSSPPQSPIPQNRDTLVEAARAAGAKGKMNKAQAAKYLKRNVTAENRAEVARVLRVKPGPNFVSRLGKKIGALAATTKTLPSIMGPAAAGVLAYSMLPEDAQAADGKTSTGREVARGATAFTAGAGLYEGGRRLMNTLARHAPNAMRAAGGGMAMLTPQMGADMTDYTPEETAQARNWTARNLPGVSKFVGGYPREAYEMAQVPERNPARVYGNAYRPGATENPLAQARQNPDEFDRALSEFLDFATQMQASP